MKNVMKALMKAQEEMPEIKKDSHNPFTNSDYATLGNITSIVKPILRRNGIVMTQKAIGDRLHTILFHLESGEFIETEFPIVISDNPQKTGSSNTYARRYDICNLLQIVAEEDDDGNVAAKPHHRRKPTVRPS
jgi:hypothetical protein